MNYLLTFLIYFLLSPGSIEPKEGDTITKMMNGYIKFEGVDPLGADVLVVYNEDYQKVYQERTADGSTMYVKYSNGSITDYGTRNARIKHSNSDYLSEK